MDSKKEIKELVEKYPFLLPRNVWTDKLDDDYDYSYCWFKNDIPQGWWKRWGLAYLDDLKEVLEKYDFLDKFRFLQVKEKFGGLRAYNSGAPEEWFSHEYAWEYISKHTCVKCGEFPARLIDDGWVSPWCDDCFKKNHGNLNKREFAKYSEKWVIDKDSRLQEYLVINHFSKDGNYQEWIDMKPFYDKIGWKYSDDDLILKDELLKIREEKENGKK